MNQVIEQDSLTSQRLTQDELNAQLAYFTGTEKWYRHWLHKQFIYTDGVQYFAENGGSQGAYWFLDKVASEIIPLLKAKKEPFACVTLRVGEIDQSQARVSVTDGNDHDLAAYHIHYTDMQTGNWKFYLIDDQTHVTLLLPSEY